MMMISPCSELDIADNEPFFLHKTLPNDNTPQYQSSLENGSAVQEILSGQSQIHDRTDGVIP